MKYYTNNIANYTDYYPFGMTMPGRQFTSENYRFGFNGMEKDGEEWTGNEGSHLDFVARIYDSRLGRWLSLDPLAKEYPSYSDYSGMNNNPILLIDPTGKGAEISNIKIDESTNLGTADMTIYMNLYMDPNITNVDLNTQISHQLGSPNEDGSWTINAGDGPMQAKIEGVAGKVNLKVTAKVIVNVISYDEAQRRIASEQNQANNYYKVIDDNGNSGGHNMAGSNQGVIRLPSLNSNLLDEVLIHEPWHSVANGYNDPQYPNDNYTTENPYCGYGHHTTTGLMDGKVVDGERLSPSDFDAIKPNYPYPQGGKAQQLPIGIRKGETTTTVGNGVDNRTNLSNDDLMELNDANGY